MTVDLAVATPTFLDLTFVGLEGLPAQGRGAVRRRSRALAGRRRDHRRRRRAARARDGAGGAARRRRRRRLRARRAWSATASRLPERRSPRTPTTVVMPVDGDRSMVTVDPGVRASAADVAALEPRAVALSLDQLYCVPAGRRRLRDLRRRRRARLRAPAAREARGRARAVREPARGAHADRGRRRRGRRGGARAQRRARHRHARRARGDGGRRGPEHASRRRSRRRRSTRRARAICSSPPTSGATCAAPRRRSACAGRCSTPASRSPRRREWAARSARRGCSRKGRSAGLRRLRWRLPDATVRLGPTLVAALACALASRRPPPRPTSPRRAR